MFKISTFNIVYFSENIKMLISASLTFGNILRAIRNIWSGQSFCLDFIGFFFDAI